MILTRLLHAGEPISIYVPDFQYETIRDFAGLLNDARIVERKEKQRLHSFLLRSNFIYRGKKRWVKAHFNCLAKVKMKHSVQQVVLQEYVDAVHG